MRVAMPVGAAFAVYLNRNKALGRPHSDETLYAERNHWAFSRLVLWSIPTASAVVMARRCLVSFPNSSGGQGTSFPGCLEVMGTRPLEPSTAATTAAVAKTTPLAGASRRE